MTDHHLLVPTDLSEFGAAALRYAAALRQPLDAAMTVLYCDEPGYPLAAPDLVLDRLAKHVAASVPAPLPNLRVARGYAMQSSLDTADDIDASLIVMGTHGRRGWRRLLLGSVTENVLRQSKRPVITIGPSGVPIQSPRFSTILCPVNFSLAGIDALREAGVMASRLDADLLVLYVAEPSGPPLSSDLELEFSGWIDPQLRGRCRYRQMIASGDAAERVLETADQVRADLLVIGAQHARFRDTTIIGSTSEKIARFAECPVMTVVRPAEEEARHVRAASHAHDRNTEPDARLDRVGGGTRRPVARDRRRSW